MGREIERKFLVASPLWNDGSPGERLVQGYLARGGACTVRVRIAGDHAAWLTLKGRTVGISRAEFEYSIPPAEARELLALCDGPLVEKTRHRVHHGRHCWEIDVFHGANDGLVLAEVELADESDAPEPPPWIGREVSHDARYFNSRLALHPFSVWPPDDR